MEQVICSADRLPILHEQFIAVTSTSALIPTHLLDAGFRITTDERIPKQLVRGRLPIHRFRNGPSSPHPCRIHAHA
jgi:hypothetical protein